MTEDHSSDISESSEKSVATNITVSELAARRLGANQATEPTEEVEETAEVEEEAEVASDELEETEEEVEESEESSETEAESEVSSEDVLSQIDLDEMSEEDLSELGKKLGSKAVERFGKLTAQRKAAEEELQKLRASLEASSNDPLKGTQQIKNNPYGNIDTIEGIQKKADEINNIVEWAEDVLFNADGYGPDDVVTEVEGKELTKADVRKSLLNARKSRDKFLPAQLNVLQSKEQGQQLKSAFESKATDELSWLQGEDNDTRKNYEAMVADPRFKKLTEVADPEIGAQLNYIMAHAANSIYGKKLVPTSTKSTSLTPPKTAVSAASTSEKTVGKSTKALKNLSQQFRQSGNRNDFITLRTLQLKNR